VVWSEDDRRFMLRALDLASHMRMQEVPVGAVLAVEGKILGEGWNHPIAANDPTMHAEVHAIREAANKVGNYRLPGSVLYVTLEPCTMCAGVIVQARIERLVFGARDLRYGGVRSKFRLADSELLNHQTRVEEGLLATEAAQLLNMFFELRRGAAVEKKGAGFADPAQKC
jgi:tRNA(adenine34) deaminase